MATFATEQPDAHAGARTDEDSQTDADAAAAIAAAIDKAYNELIRTVLGDAAVAADQPLREAIGASDTGGVTIVPDASDLGYVEPKVVTTADREALARAVLEAVRRSYAEIPLDPNE